MKEHGLELQSRRVWVYAGLSILISVGLAILLWFTSRRSFDIVAWVAITGVSSFAIWTWLVYLLEGKEALDD